MRTLRGVNSKIKTNWQYWVWKLWIAMFVLSGVASSGNRVLAQTIPNFTLVNECGLSISGGYGNNGNIPTNNAWQIVSTFNTNPCSNQTELEKLRQENESKRELIRQENESKRELIRVNAQIITNCINARVQAVQKDVDPDVVCKLTEFQNLR